MSLIHDALLDLESRKNDARQNNDEDTGRSDTGSLNTDNHCTVSEKKSRHFIWFLGTGVCLLSVIFLPFDRFVMEKPTHSIVESKTDKQVILDGNESALSITESEKVVDDLRTNKQERIVETAFNAEATSPVENKEIAVSTSVEDGIAEGDIDNDKKIADLLVRIQSAIDDRRLTVPVYNNALYYLNALALIDPENTEAKTKRAEVEGVFIAMLQRELTNGRFERAETLIKRLPGLGVSEGIQSHYRDQLTTRRAQIDDVNKSQDESLVTVTPTNITPTNITTTNITPSSGESDYQKVASKTQAESSWVTVSSRTQENEALARFEKFLSEGNPTLAEQELISFLQENPQVTESKVRLFDLYLDSQALDKAHAIKEALSQDSDALAYINARMAYALNDINAAIKILEEKAPTQRMVSRQYTFQAGLYQKIKRHADAERMYARLLENNPGSHQLWLGYAIAADGSKNINKATLAYKRVLQLGHSDAAVIKFVKQRLAALGVTKLSSAEDRYLPSSNFSSLKAQSNNTQSHNIQTNVVAEANP